MALSFFDDRIHRLAQADGVVVGLRHLAPIETRHLGRRGEQGFGLGQDRDAGPFEVAEQPIAVGDRQTRVGFDQRAGLRERFGVALFLVLLAQRPVHRGVARSEALDRLLGLLLELRLAAVDVVEAARDLARDLDVRHLVLAHRDVLRAVQQDVGGLQQRIAEESVRGQIAVGKLRLLILVGRHALQPAERGDHRQQQMQLGMLGHARLDEQRRDARVQARRQPVDRHRPDVLLELRGVLVAGRERMPVGDEEIAFVLVLQLDPVLQRAVVVAQMQHAGRAHTGQHAPILNGPAHARALNNTLITRPTSRNAGSNSHPSIPSADRPSTMQQPDRRESFPAAHPTSAATKPASTRPPSSGGTGSRLNTASSTLVTNARLRHVHDPAYRVSRCHAGAAPRRAPTPNRTP